MQCAQTSAPYLPELQLYADFALAVVLPEQDHRLRGGTRRNCEPLDHDRRGHQQGDDHLQPSQTAIWFGGSKPPRSREPRPDPTSLYGQSFAKDLEGARKIVFHDLREAGLTLDEVIGILSKIDEVTKK